MSNQPSFSRQFRSFGVLEHQPLVLLTDRRPGEPHFVSVGGCNYMEVCRQNPRLGDLHQVSSSSNQGFWGCSFGILRVNFAD